MRPIATPNLTLLLALAITCAMQGFLQFGLCTGLSFVVLGCLLGYFLGDLRVAVSHFIMDNYQPDSSGHQHHKQVAKEGYHSEEEIIACAPFCRPCAPCEPCSPDRQENSRKPKMTIAWFIIGGLLVLAPQFAWIGVSFAVMEAAGQISAAGIPDYYAHHRDLAPSIVKFAQDYHLLMTPETHRAHHQDPSIGYAYFSPLTNFVLDRSGFWHALKHVILLVTGKHANPVPALQR
mmetsp:Transcript_119997/g.208387  ORF Transcript_119997/g.208387 Transcript_119997/m.208387 type:complete len:234 (+) Transcript_119997:84-785(+)